MVSRCFNLHFSDYVEHLVICLFAIYLYIFAGEVSVMVFGPFFKLSCLFCFLFYKFIYLFLAVLSLRCCTWAFLVVELYDLFVYFGN